MALANVSLQDTFDTWRIRTNQLIVQTDQAFELAYFAANNTSNSINATIIYSNSIGNVCNSYAMSYANGIGNTVNSYLITYISDVVGTSVASMSYANTVANNANIATRAFANSKFATLANAAIIYAQANVANTKIASISGTTGRITSSTVQSGTNFNTTLDLATAGPGSGTYGSTGVSGIGVDAYGRVTSVATANYQPALGFTPVQQGGGFGQGTNKIYIGWSNITNSDLRLQVDSTNFGASWPISITGSASSAASATLAAKASTLSQGGGNGVGMTFSYTLQAGTPPRVWGTADGTNIATYNPANFSVAYAGNSGTTNQTSWTNLTATSAMYSPIYYDSNNTAYYCDPTGTSVLTNVNVNGTLNGYGTSYFYSNKGASTSLLFWNGPGLQAVSTDGGTAFMSFHRLNNYAINMGLDYDNWFRIGGWSSGTTALFQMDMSGNGLFNASVRAPIFYDTNNTNYYCDPTGSTVITNLYYNNGYGSSQLAYGCRSWLSFTGTSGAARGSGGVTSISRSSTGYYTCTFSFTYPDANYAVTSATGSSSGLGQYTASLFYSSCTTTTVSLYSGTSSAFSNPTAIDMTFDNLSVHR